jgi:Zn-dependent protease with chaperone function
VQASPQKAGIGMPEVAIYEGEPNAFATGAFKNSALVAVSTGLLQTMNREEVEAVIGHEVAHVANGDMVTMTLIQGVMNTFVVFLSRVIGYFVDKVILRNDRDGPGIGYYVTTVVLDLVLGVLAAIIVAWFSRQREYRADAGAAALMGRKQPMINALARLGGMDPASCRRAVARPWASAAGQRPDGAVPATRRSKTASARCSKRVISASMCSGSSQAQHLTHPLLRHIVGMEGQGGPLLGRVQLHLVGGVRRSRVGALAIGQQALCHRAARRR